MATKLRITKKRLNELIKEEVRLYKSTNQQVLSESVTHGLVDQLLRTYMKRVEEFKSSVREAFSSLDLNGELEEKDLKKIIKTLTANYFKFSSKLDKVSKELLHLEEKLHLGKAGDDVLPPEDNMPTKEEE